LKASGRLAVDTNAVIAYREGIPEVCTLISPKYVSILKKTELLFLKMTYGLQQHVWSSKFHFSAGMVTLSMLKG